MYKLFFVIILKLSFAFHLSARVYDITDFGAKGDSKTLNSKAIQQAIDECAKNGGGKVYFPAGNWLSGTIQLKTNVTLHLEKGSFLLGSITLDDYPEKVPSIRSYTDGYTRRSLIYAENEENIAIEGEGTIDGNGASYWKQPELLRPYILRIINCKDVRIEGIFMKNPAMWNQHYFVCERVRITGIRVWGFSNYNNDGVDIDGCSDVVISKCFMTTSDDGLTLKSTSEYPCKNIVISDCVISSRSSAIKMGTESMGGFQNISIINCTVSRVPSHAPRIFQGRDGLVGVELIIVDGGKMENINVSNIIIEGTSVPLCVRLGNRGRGLVDPEKLPAGKKPERRPVGTVKNISLSNIIATGGGKNVGILLLGNPGHPIENISLDHITIINEGGGKDSLVNRVIPEREHDYPQAAWWGVMPAYGLYARHIHGLNISNIQLMTVNPDERYALVLDDVENAILNGVACSPGKGKNELMSIIQTKNIFIQGCRPQSDDGAFLKISGDKSKNISLIGNEFLQIKQVLNKLSEVPDSEIRLTGNIH